MEEILEIAAQDARIEEDEFLLLRRALLLTESEHTRRRGERKLERLSKRNETVLSSIANAGLMMSSFCSGRPKEAIHWAQVNRHYFPLTPATLWTSSLLVHIFKSLGMKRERYDAEQERFRLLRKVAFQSEVADHRMYALQELKRELEDRDRISDAEICAAEIRDLQESLAS